MADRRACARVRRELEQGEPAPWDPSEALSRPCDAAAAILGVDGAAVALGDERGTRRWRPASALLAGALGGEVLDELAWLAVPRLADWCYVALVQPDGSIAQQPAAFADRHHGRRLASLRDRRPIDPASAHPVAAAIRSGQLRRYGDNGDGTGERAGAAAPGPQAQRLLGLVRPGSAVVVPLRGRAGVVGAIVLGSHRPDRYGEDDLAVIEQLARRTGIAIERTRRTLGIPTGAAVDGGQQQRA